jgi:hypothetical protein
VRDSTWKLVSLATAVRTATLTQKFTRDIRRMTLKMTLKLNCATEEDINPVSEGV